MDMRKSDVRYKYTYITKNEFFHKNVSHFTAKHIAKKNTKKILKNVEQICRITTYDGSDQIVHPDMVCRDGVLYMTCTPYPYRIDTYENPCVYCGDSVFGFRPLAKNPIALPQYNAKGNHLSDPCIIDKNGVFNILFRESLNVNGKVSQRFLLTASSDGVKWTEPKKIYTSDSSQMLSPAMVFDSDNYYVYHIDWNDENGGNMVRLTFDSRFSVTDETLTEVRDLPENMAIWHICVCNSTYGKDVGSDKKLLGLFTLRDLKSPGVYKNYWAHADLSENVWYIDEQLDIPENIQSNIGFEYKSCIIPVTGDVFLSYYDKSDRCIVCLVPGDRDRRGERSEEFVDAYRVFLRVFGCDISFKNFSKKHKNNTDRLEHFFVNMQEEGKSIGTNSFMGSLACYGEKTFIAAQSCDSAVVPEARGKGVFTQIVNEAEELLRQDGVDMLIGFPNNNSYPGFMKMGWQHIGSLNTLVCVTKPADLVYSKLAKKSAAKNVQKAHARTEKFLAKHNMTLSSFTSCPFSEDDLNVINNCGRIRIKRTAEYFKWKVDDNKSDAKYKVLRGKGLLGYIVYRVDRSGHICIMDWFVRDTSDKNYTCFLKLLINSVRDEGNAVVVPFINGGSREEKAFKSIGFLSGNNRLFRFSEAKLIIKPLLEGNIPSDVSDCSKWFVTQIDTDTILN